MKKIAFPTNDGETISRHLGEAQYYVIAILNEDGDATFEKRAKPCHNHDQETHFENYGEDSTQRGPAMFTPILDCEILISGGMGQHAYDHAVARGLEVILPAQKNIADALNAYRNGTLVSDMRRIHKQ